MTPTARVLVVEDERSARDLVVASLEHPDLRIEAAADASEALRLVDAYRPDLVIVDVMLGGTDGFALVRSLRERTDVPVIFLSGRAEVEYRLEGFRAGGDDYIVKPFHPDELVARVHALLKRAGRSRSHTWQVDDLVVDRDARYVVRGGQDIHLTKLEFDLLDALASRPGHVWSKEMLLEVVWGTDALDHNVVEVHMSQLRHKLETVGARLIHTVRGFGYILKPSDTTPRTAAVGADAPVTPTAARTHPS